MQSASVAATPVAPPRLSQRDRGVLAILLSSAFVVILNETTMNVAISQLIADPKLDIDARSAQWLTTAFMLTMAVIIPVTGWLLQRYQTRPMYVTAMSLFTAGTLIAALAPNFSVLLLARVVQASGTAIVFPLLMTTIMMLVPPQIRGKIMGTISLVISVAPAMGPVISGAILQFFNWRFVFVFVLPIALVMLALGAKKLVNVGEITMPKLDAVSVPLSAFGFGGLVYALSQIGEGGGPAWALPVAAIVGGISMTLFVLRQLRLAKRNEALLDLRTFRYPLFRIAIVLMTIASAAMFGSLILLPLLMQDSLGLDPILVGATLLPGGILMGLMGPWVGKLYDKMGPRPLVVPGGFVVFGGLLMLTLVTIETSWWFVLAVHIIMSLGFAFTFPPLMTVALGALPVHLYSYGSAVVGTVQQVAGAIGTAAFMTIMATTRDGLIAQGTSDGEALLSGAHWAFIAAASLWVVGIVCSFFLRKPDDVIQDPADVPDAEAAAAQ